MEFIFMVILMAICVILIETKALNSSAIGFFWMIGLIAPAIIRFIIDNVRMRPKYDNGISKSEITTSNEYLTNNKDKLDKLYDADYKHLKPIKRRIIYSILLFVLSIVSVFYVRDKTYGYIVIISSLLIVTYYLVQYRNVEYGIYDSLVKKVLHDFNSDLEYQNERVFTKEEYYTCLFPE